MQCAAKAQKAKINRHSLMTHLHCLNYMWYNIRMKKSTEKASKKVPQSKTVAKGQTNKSSIQKFYKKPAYIIAIILFISLGGVAFANPGHIIEKTLDLIGIDGPANKLKEREQSLRDGDTKDTKQSKSDDSQDNKPDTGKEGSDEIKTNSNNPEPTGQYTQITPDDLQALKDKGQPYLIAKQDWNVKINSKTPTYCGSQATPCPQSETARVNLSAINVKTGELLPITECNGVVNKPYSFSNATTSALVDSYHCEISYQPSSTGMYRLQAELYLSKSVYTDTIYWGGWVWGTDSPNTDGYFAN